MSNSSTWGHEFLLCTSVVGSCLLQKPKIVHSDNRPSGTSQDNELPTELDFFKYAQGGSAKRKAIGGLEQDSKKRRLDDSYGDSQETEGDADIDRRQTHTPRKDRVTVKGSNIPGHIESFDALRERYQISSHILSNLSEHGYIQPTGIQSYGIPILLEVSILAVCVYDAHQITPSLVILLLSLQQARGRLFRT